MYDEQNKKNVTHKSACVSFVSYPLYVLVHGWICILWLNTLFKFLRLIILCCSQSVFYLKKNKAKKKQITKCELVQFSWKTIGSCSVFKWCYEVNDPGGIVLRLWVFVHSKVRKDWKKRDWKFSKKQNKTTTTEIGTLINSVALPEMLLTSSPRQQFYLFFILIFWFIYPSFTSQFILIPFLSSVVSHPATHCSTVLHLRTLYLLIPHLSIVLLLTISSFPYSTFPFEKKKRISRSLLLLELHKSDTPLHLRVKNQRKNSTFFLLRGKNSFQHHRGYWGQLLLAINFTHT